MNRMRWVNFAAGCRKVMGFFLIAMALGCGLFAFPVMTKAAPLLEYGDEAIYQVGNSLRDKKNNYLLKVGDTATFTATQSVYNNIDAIDWGISNTSVLSFVGATPSPDARRTTMTVRGRAPGVATVNGNVLSSYIFAGVYDMQWCPNPFPVRVVEPLSQITLEKTQISLVEGESGEVSVATMTPDSLYSLVFSVPFTYVSSDPSVVTVDSSGNLQAVSYGTAIVSVSTVDGVTAQCTVTVTSKGHSLTRTAAKAATCTAAGNIEYWTCSKCGKKFSNAAGTAEITNVTAAAKGHSLKKTAAKAATCTAAGNIEYWACSTCGRKFSNAAGTAEITSVTVAAKGHSLTRTAAKAATCKKTGNITYWSCSTCGKKFSNAAGTAEITSVTVAAKGHSWGSWKTASNATVFKAAVQKKTCKVCKASVTRKKGSALRPTMKLTAATIPLKLGQKTTLLKVTGMAKGDSVASWKSSNTSIVRVSGKASGACTLAAQKKPGTAKITIKLKSGLTKQVTVKVQKASVAAKTIKNIPEKAAVKKGKTLTLKPQLNPLTSQDKVKYTTSNKKVATVNSKGKITGKKKGTAVITVKAGKAVAKCKVTVK